MLYEVAFASGLRRKELMALTVDHLEVENCGLRLDAEWTKGRREDFQPLPKRLVDSLRQFIESRTAKKLYEQFYEGRTASQWSELPEEPLLYVPTQVARTLYTDLKAAEIRRSPKKARPTSTLAALPTSRTSLAKVQRSKKPNHSHDTRRRH